MERVFQKINAIEQSRQHSRHSSIEDIQLLASAQDAMAAKQQPPAQPNLAEQGKESITTAEISLRENSEGGGSKKSKRQHRHKSSRNSSSRSGQKPRSQSSTVQSDSEGSSCTIF